MTGLVLTPREDFEARVDLGGVLPGMADLSKHKIGYGGSLVELGELFDVSGSANGRLIIEGGGRLDRVGARLVEGEIVVKGDVGHSLGSRMTGGSIVVDGSAGDFAAAEIFGGKVVVSDSVGAHLGAAGDGSRKGMSGGVVTVGGSAGRRACERLRGGVVVVSGDVAEEAATDLIAGSLAVAGKLGPNAGRGMKRGTLFLRSADGLASGFHDAGDHDLVMLRVLVRRSPELAAFLGKDVTKARRYAGDLNIAGKGEALIVSR